LTFSLAIPFWVYSAINSHQLMPGLPMAALMFVCPGLAAIILVGRAQGSSGVRGLFVRAIDCTGVRPRIFYVPLLLLNPAVFAVSYMVMLMLGAPVPAFDIQILPTLALCLVFIVAALGEELGWSGYAIDPLQQRWGALRASLLLGIVWAALHWIALAQAQRSFEWIGWWTLWTVAQRVIMVWLYNSTHKSLFATVILHASSNVCWQLFPIQGSFFDPRITGLIMTVVAMAALALQRRREIIPTAGG
jgi:uncharacterized protein